MNKKSQQGVILNYLQHHPIKKVLASDFVNPNIFSRFPYIGYSASARFSELKKKGLIELVGTCKGIKKFLRKSKDRNYRKITKKGLEYKLK